MSNNKEILITPKDIDYQIKFYYNQAIHALVQAEQCINLSADLSILTNNFLIEPELMAKLKREICEGCVWDRLPPNINSPADQLEIIKSNFNLGKISYDIYKSMLDKLGEGIIKPMERNETKEEKSLNNESSNHSLNRIIIADVYNLDENAKELFDDISLANYIIKPVVQNYYRSAVSHYKTMVIEEDKHKIIAKGNCFEQKIEVEYDVCTIKIFTSTHIVEIIDKEITTYFWELLQGNIPDFSEKAFFLCYYVLGFYTYWDEDPYDFYGEHSIKGQVWNQFYDGGNEIYINRFKVFASEREQLYAAMNMAKEIKCKKKYNIVV